MYVSLSQDCREKGLDGAKDGEVKEAQRRQRVDSAAKRKLKTVSGVQGKCTTTAVAKDGLIAKASKMNARKSQRQSVSRKHDVVVSHLLSYQTHQQRQLLFNYETAGPWFDEVSQRVYVIVHTYMERKCLFGSCMLDEGGAKRKQTFNKLYIHSIRPS